MWTWRSTDGGSSSEPWKRVNDLLAPVNRASGSLPFVSLAFNRSLPGRLYLRVRGLYT